MATIVYDIDGHTNVDTLLLGVSPELEMALYTICYAVQDDDDDGECVVMFPECCTVRLHCSIFPNNLSTGDTQSVEGARAWHPHEARH